MSQNRFEFHYTPADVASAQRMRFLKSNQLKLILLVGGGMMLFTAAPLILPGVFPAVPSASWGLVLEIALAYLVTMGVLILITPFAEYYMNRFWRLPLVLQFNEKQLRVSVSGKNGGLRMKWHEIRRLEENGRLYMLFYGPGNKYLILPKSAFHDEEAAQRRFDNLLALRSTVPTPAVEKEDELDEAYNAGSLVDEEQNHPQSGS